jgi:perosamine synthetase
MRWVGIDKDTWKRVESLTNLEDYGYHWFYEIRDIGFKYNMNNLAAALGISQLNKLDDINLTKNNAIRRYIHNLRGSDDYQFLMDYELNWTGSYWLFGLRVKNRTDLINFLTRKEVSTGVHFTPLNHQPFFSKYSGKTPVSDSLYPEILTLPLYPMMNIEEVDFVCDVIKEYYQK